MSTIDHPTIYGDLLAPLAESADAQRVLAVPPSDVKPARPDERLVKDREGTVTDDEAAELDAYERFEHVVRLLKPLLEASLMASMLAASRAPIHQMTTRPSQPGVPRREAPLHPRRLALQLAVACQAMAQAFDLQGSRPRGAGIHWRRSSHLLARGLTGAVARPCSISPAEGNVSPWHGKMPPVKKAVMVIERQQLQWTHMV